jgi:hypothetical protein
MEENKYYVISVEDTKKYGIIQAAIIGRIRFWCEYNQKNKTKDRYHNGYWWSGFISSKEFSEQLGISVRTIEKNLSSLLKDSIILKDVFNKKKYDRTGWYRVNPFTPIEDTIYSNRVNGNTLIEELEIPQLGKPIPVIHTINQNVNQSASITINQKSLEEDIEQIEIQLDIIKNENNFEINETRGKLVSKKYQLEKQLLTLKEN